MKILRYPKPDEIAAALKRPQTENNSVRKDAMKIIEAVKQHGDKAVHNLENKFDGVRLTELVVKDEELVGVEDRIDDKLKSAIETARKNIFKFHIAQKPLSLKIDIDEGITCGRKSVPIEKVGLYVPGGGAALFSTLLMLAIPAQIAGCKNIAVCSPPQRNGKISDQILYVAKLLGVKNIFKIGGAQAIAAMAFGTESVPKVNKIFGPGNQWVTAAKQIVNSFGVAIDMPAGPSEVLIIADDSANAKFAAADMLSQAEHGPESQTILISTSEEIIKAVASEIRTMQNQLSRKEIIRKSLEHAVLLLVASLDEAIEISNLYAPEHLILSIENAETFLGKITSAGSVFLGNYSPESAGDYASGTNHTLPTNGFASAYNGLSVESFMKQISFQKLTKSGLKKIAQAVETLAEAEGLDAHKLAVSLRRTNG